ncbi:YdaS family helix-turn-helix protein [Caballeronia sp. AZ10_KS36]|uniref:YdaS family helix-turn-helix protein n=1 Tax=Caballeronia sp. AZ10_KS36 TaxID=2921757 RepID=UPI002028CBCF|nr:YdaS family helix-turn-helix protein [Caballeronia sp. AZ10_KS36]
MADAIGVSGYQVIQDWRKRGRVPPAHCKVIEQLTGERSELLNGDVDWAFYRKTGAVVDSEAAPV